MNIIVNGKNRKVKSRKLSKILEELNISPEEFLVVRKGELITLDTVIKQGDSLELLSIVSGG